MKHTRRRRSRYTKKDLAVDALIAVIWIAIWLFFFCKALHVFAAPAPVDFRIRDGIQTGYAYQDELQTMSRQELADMRAAEEWTEPAVVYVPASVPETAAPVIVPETEPQTAPTSSTSRFTERERYLLLHIMMHEAGNQGVTGQALVGRVVLNRVESGQFPNDIESVLFQPGQFGPESSICRYEPNADSYAALDLLEAGWDESRGALYFCTSSFSWATYLFTYGGHNFFV